MNKTAKKSITWHSPIRLERPCTTLLGRMRQRIQILAGDLLTPTSQPDLQRCYRKVFGTFFHVLDAWQQDTIHQKGQTTVKTTYTQTGLFSVEAVTEYYHRKRLLQRVEWQIVPRRNGTDLIIQCEAGLLERLIALDFLRGL